MQRSGWIKLWRNMMEQPIWLEDPFTRGQAWVDLQMLASGIEDERHHKGWVYCSVRYLAKRWQWGFDRTKRFLLLLEEQGWIMLYPERTRIGADFSTVSGAENGALLSLVPQGIAAHRRTASGTENQTKKRTNKEVYRSMRQTAGSSGAIEKEIPAEYQGRFSSWAEYADWRYQ